VTRIARLTALLAAASLLLAAGATGCASTRTDGIAVSGTTSADLVTVSAPKLDTPAMDVTIGIANLQTPQLQAVARKKAQAAAAASASNRSPVPAGRLATVTVQAGDTVKKGQVIAVFDDAGLKLAVQYVEAGYKRVRKTADTLDANASDLRDQRETVYDARAQLLTGITQMKQGIAGIAQMKSGIAQMTSGLAQMDAGLGQMSAALSKIDAGRAQLASALAAAEHAAETTPAPPGIDEQIAALKQQIAKLDGQRASLITQRTALQKQRKALAGQLAGLKATLAAVQKKIPGDPAALLAQMQSGKAQVASALSKMADGISQMENGADTMRVGSEAQSAALKAARQALSDATLRAPCDGVVVSAMPGGQVAMVGAPVVVIRPSGETLVDVYLEADQLAGVKPGVTADIALDSVPNVLKGTVRTVWSTQTFPPTAYPTKVVHLSRVTRVTVRVADDALPRGVPADVVIHPSP
jgi:X-X-X-Leu-X-X-Gly heptad repeat protein